MAKCFYHSFRWSQVQTSAQRPTTPRPLWFALAIPHKYRDSPCNYIAAAPFHILYNQSLITLLFKARESSLEIIVKLILKAFLHMPGQALRAPGS